MSPFVFTGVNDVFKVFHYLLFAILYRIVILPEQLPVSYVQALSRPNIVIFMADDLGFANVSFSQGNRQTPTPNIDHFAWDGIILNRHYTMSSCTPTRSQFMTGQYNFHTGMHGGVIEDGMPWGLPLQFPTQADLIRHLGYQTWLVGKWHLGQFQRAYYPNSRGFDQSFGHLGSEVNWFNYTIGWITPFPFSGRDLRENGKSIPANNTNNIFLPELINNKAEQLIHNADTSQPFYLWFATPLPHSSFEDYHECQFTMPQFQLRPPVLAFSDAFPERKKQLGIIRAFI